MARFEQKYIKKNSEEGTTFCQDPPGGRGPIPTPYPTRRPGASNLVPYGARLPSKSKIRHWRRRQVPCIAAVQCSTYGKFQCESGECDGEAAPCRAAPRRTVPCRVVPDPNAKEAYKLSSFFSSRVSGNSKKNLKFFRLYKLTPTSN